MPLKKWEKEELTKVKARFAELNWEKNPTDKAMDATAIHLDTAACPNKVALAQKVVAELLSGTPHAESEPAFDNIDAGILWVAFVASNRVGMLDELPRIVADCAKALSARASLRA